AGDPNPALQVRRARRLLAEPDARLLGAALEHAAHPDAGRDRPLGRLDRALLVEVAPPQLDRVDAEREREPGHHLLGRELRLRRSEAPEGARRYVVRVDDPR